MTWQAVARAIGDFGVHLYRQLKVKEGNLFFSPYSLSMALAMTYAGARGRTAEQMARTLCFRLSQDQLHTAFAALEVRLAEVGQKGQVELKVANALWPQVGYPFLANYLTLVEQHYGVRITAVDYRDPEAARQMINAWVEDRTEKKIRDLIPPRILKDLTTLVLTNAIYFKGNWARPFDPRDTLTAPFWVTSERSVQVPMMKQTGRFRYAKAKNVQILELPYGGKDPYSGIHPVLADEQGQLVMQVAADPGADLSMIVFLPVERQGLAVLEEALTAESLDRWTASLDETTIQLYLPRFELECPFDLGLTLRALGMADAFSGEADFSGMDGTTSLFIDEVLHKAFVCVNEAGTEASAATAVIMSKSLPPTFRADHPFLFLIRDNDTGTVLFLGRVVDPGPGG